jgi:hypothetical protein
LKHLADTPGTGDQPGIDRASCVSHVLRSQSLVASGCDPTRSKNKSPYVQSSLWHSFQEPSLSISGARNQKLPLTHRRRPFAASEPLLRALKRIWHRLSVCLQASPRGPFIVELFAAADLQQTPEMSLPGSRSLDLADSRRLHPLNAPKGRRTPVADLKRTLHTALTRDGLG